MQDRFRGIRLLGLIYLVLAWLSWVAPIVCAAWWLGGEHGPSFLVVLVSWAFAALSFAVLFGLSQLVQMIAEIHANTRHALAHAGTMIQTLTEQAPYVRYSAQVARQIAPHVAPDA